MNWNIFNKNIRYTKGWEYMFLVFVFLVTFYCCHYPYIHEAPIYAHAGTQSDRYAIALGFLDNGMDFFHPQFFNLHFDPTTFPLVEQGITAIDFPIHEYIIAFFMKIIGSDSPFIFRMYVWIVGVVGIFALYTTLRRYSTVFIAFIGTSSLLFSPVWSYYWSGFLPSITSLSTICIGLFYWSKYTDTSRSSAAVIGVFFFTLSALTRTPIAILLIALVAERLVFYWQYKVYRVLEIKLLIASFAVLLLHFMYNRYYLKALYGVGFLGEFMYFDNWKDFKSACIQVYSDWGLTQFSFLQYVLYVGLVILAFYKIYFLPKKTEKEVFSWVNWLIIIFIGSVLYLFLMLRQIPTHDYYCIDSLFIAITVSLVVITKKIGNTFSFPSWTAYIGIGLISYFLILGVKDFQHYRRATGDWDRATITYENFSDSDAFLDSVGVSQTAKILVIDAYGTNLPFLQMRRKGYAVLVTSPENIQTGLQEKYDYVVIQNCYLLSDVVRCYLPITNELEKIATNNKITIYKKKIQAQSLEQFLGIDSTTTLFIHKNDSLQQLTDDQVAITIDDNISILPREIYVFVDVKIQDMDKSPEISMRFFDNKDKIIVAKTYKIAELIPNPNGWKTAMLSYPIPVTNAMKMDIIVQNTCKNTSFYKNVKIIGIR